MAESRCGRVDLPDKDPTREIVAIEQGNMMALAPWFHEFDMRTHMAQCDWCLEDKVESITNKYKSGSHSPYRSRLAPAPLEEAQRKQMKSFL